MRKLALLLSLLALGALGLVACGEGHDEDSATEAKVFAHTPPEGKLSREQAQELKGETLPPEKVQELKREANTWAALFAGVATSQLVRERAARPNACNRYVGQPICERLACERKYWIENFENCTPVSAAYQKSFAGATIEDIVLKAVAGADGDTPIYLAAVKFSNGEVVAFNGTGDESYSCAGAGSGCTWNIAEEAHNRRFLEAAAPRE